MPLSIYSRITGELLVTVESPTLQRTDLRGIALPNADLRQMDLSYSTVQDAVLYGSDLTDALMHSSRLSGADFSSAILHGAILTYADLSGACFHNADLSKSHMVGINAMKLLVRTDFRGANLTGANLSGSYLLGADFSGANLEGAILEGARYDSDTQWPVGFDPARYGAIDTFQPVNISRGDSGVSSRSSKADHNHVHAVSRLSTALGHLASGRLILQGHLLSNREGELSSDELLAHVDEIASCKVRDDKTADGEDATKLAVAHVDAAILLLKQIMKG